MHMIHSVLCRDFVKNSPQYFLKLVEIPGFGASPENQKVNGIVLMDDPNRIWAVRLRIGTVRLLDEALSEKAMDDRGVYLWVERRICNPQTRNLHWSKSN